ncbi:MAG: cytochrome c [Ignavibacteria bacterium]|nr:cytochrome c [Ignavibacteria bacterium]
MEPYKKIEDEIKFLDLLKSPIRLFGWVFIYLLIIVTALGIYFAENLTTISFNEQIVSIPDFSNVKMELFEKKGEVIPAVNLSLIKNPTKEMIEKGKSLYEINCKSCHGDKGLGDGPAGQLLNPKARNFTQIDGWTNGRTFDQVYKTLQEGIISRGMSAYEYISPSDRFDIILYIWTLSEMPLITTEQLTMLDQKYNLSKGTLLPNQISTDKAMKLIDGEETTKLAKLDTITEKLNQFNASLGARLLNKNLTDTKKLSLFIITNNITYERIVEIIKTDPGSIGFKQSVLRLESADLRQMVDFIKKLSIVNN